jgi:hypothetical protein
MSDARAVSAIILPGRSDLHRWDRSYSFSILCLLGLSDLPGFGGDIALFSRQAIVIWLVPERTVLCLGNIKRHRIIGYVSPSSGTVEAAK